MFAKAHEYPRLGGKRKGEIVSGNHNGTAPVLKCIVSADESKRTKQEFHYRELQ